jgi:hypothetical protein
VKSEQLAEKKQELKQEKFMNEKIWKNSYKKKLNTGRKKKKEKNSLKKKPTTVRERKVIQKVQIRLRDKTLCYSFCFEITKTQKEKRKEDRNRKRKQNIFTISLLVFKFLNF